jgi:RNA polymerase sigma factor (sigma-70 family)
VLDELGDVERAIVKLTDAGYSQQEIGEVLGVSQRGVEGRLYRLRQKDIRNRVKGDRDGG